MEKASNIPHQMPSSTIYCKSVVPPSILETILDLLKSHTSRNGRSLAWKISDTVQAKSAQQKVFILTVQPTSENTSYPTNTIIPPSSLDLSSSGKSEWECALHSGRNKLVLRMWEGGSRWWNLNRNEDPRILAQEEVEGYRMAGLSFRTGVNQRDLSCKDIPLIPRILYFHAGSPSRDSAIEDPTWGLMEYVGPHECGRLREASDAGNTRESNLGPAKIIDRSYLEGMIKTRMEFGFEEPHPRWGRVPVNQSLEYARIILDEVMIPLHRSSRALFRQQSQRDPKTYACMIKIYKEAWTSMTNSLSSTRAYGTEISRVRGCLHRLNQALRVLETYDCELIPPMDPVLVHMDLQPQNLIFWKSMRRGNHQPSSPRVFSVLDWEDAAWADPRFDLVLLCRKVCANRKQAEQVWIDYDRIILHEDHADNDTRFGHTDCGQRSEIRTSMILGPIEAWLRLETVHSITTMLLQSMDLVNGGRNPWEKKRDLWGKLQREFTRLDGYECMEITGNTC